MSDLRNLLARSSIKVADLERIYVVCGKDQDFAADVLSLMRQLDPEVAWRAVWLLKRLAMDHSLSHANLLRLAQCAEEMSDWASRLNLCQLFAVTGCPEAGREELYPYLVDCFGNRRPMIRAWALSVLLQFRSDQKYRKQISEMLREAQADPAGSIQARLRRLKIKPA